MNSSLKLALALLVVLGLTATSRADDGGYQSLLRRLPDSTTAVVLIDVKGLRDTLGVAPGTALSSADMSGIPITASKFVLGSHLDLGEHRHLWSVALFQIDGKMTIQDVAKSEQEPVQKMAEHSVVLSPRNAYFIDLGPGLMASGTPANRQLLSRWLRFQDTNQLDTLSPYLLKATNPTNPAMMIAAIDLVESMDPAAVRRGLDRSQALASRPKSDYDAAAKLIAGIKGLTLTVQPGKPLAGDLTFEFQDDTRTIYEFAKPLLLEALQTTGLYIEDFDGWELQYKDRSIGIHGPLSVNALRKLGTMIRTPVPNPEAANMVAYQATDPAARAAAASLRYFKAITQILSDLKSDKSRDQNSRAGWNDHAANQLNGLPTLDVAPELIGFGTATAQQLQILSAGEKNALASIKYVHRNSYDTAYGWFYGGNSTQSVLDALKAQAAANRRTLWERIDDATAQIRRQMTQKFNTQF